MSKTLISVLILGVVLVGGYFIIKNGKGLERSPSIITEEYSIGEEAQVSEDTAKKMAFSEFIKQGGSYKCDVSQAMSDFENSGIVYIDGANVRGDFSPIAEGRPIDTTFIVKDGYTYVWSSAEPTTGFKVKMATGSNGNDSDTTNSWQESIGDYNCETWTADSSIFTAPANITFKAGSM